MNVGILTYHDINNYGAQLQAASLQQFLQSNGITAEIVDFRPIQSRVRFFRVLLKPLITLKFKKFIREISRRKGFANSIFELATVGQHPLYTTSQVEQYCEKFNVLICGSDELWNFQNYLGYQRPYILDLKIKTNPKKISYAASLGSCNPNKLLENKMKSSLSNFYKIMVRDPQTLQFISQLGFDATRVVDPTYLIDLEVPVLQNNSYMVISGILDKTQVEKAVSIAKRLNLKPISIGYSYDGFEWLAIFPKTAEWVSYIKNSSFHFTSLFHGAAFSIKSRKPYVIISPAEKRLKISTKLEIFHQRHRLIQDDTTIEEILELAQEGYDDSFEKNYTYLVENSKRLLLDAII